MLRNPDPGMNALHGESDPGSTWTRTNVAEAMPGVLSPLGWSIWGDGVELGMRRAFHGLGALRRSDVAIPGRHQDRALGIFYGRVAIRGDFICEMGDRLPGTSGTAIAEQIFGAVPSGFTSRRQPFYYPRVAIKLPWSFARTRGMLQSERVDVDAWWRKQIAAMPGAGLEEAIAALGEAILRFNTSMYKQALASYAAIQPLFDGVSKLATAGGASPASLMSGYGGHEELRMVSDLWACSRGRLDLAEFIRRHGYHGPGEGEISAVVWREDSSPLQPILDGYRAMSENDNPLSAEERRRDERIEAEAQLLRELPPRRRLPARVTLRLARAYIPLRAVGKVAFLQNLDVARAAARRIGTELHDRGRLKSPEDVFFLTAAELTGRHAALEEKVEARRIIKKEYELLDLPVVWQGAPTPASTIRGAVANQPVHGIGASSGTVEGRIVVVDDPADAVVEEGDILVTHSTDPSWAAIMFLASGLVTDIGGLFSHAAIVARELGVPCIVNTGNSTQVLRTGDRARIDGSTGEIQILARANPGQSGTLSTG